MTTDVYDGLDCSMRASVLNREGELLVSPSIRH